MPDWHHAQRKLAFPPGVATCYDLQHFATAAMNIVVAIVLLALLTTLVAFDSGDPRA